MNTKSLHQIILFNYDPELLLTASFALNYLNIWVSQLRMESYGYQSALASVIAYFVKALKQKGRLSGEIHHLNI